MHELAPDSPRRRPHEDARRIAGDRRHLVADELDRVGRRGQPGAVDHPGDGAEERLELQGSIGRHDGDPTPVGIAVPYARPGWNEAGPMLSAPRANLRFPLVSTRRRPPGTTYSSKAEGGREQWPPPSRKRRRPRPPRRS